MKALKDEPWASVRLIHTGQHFDENMSNVFFTQLELQKPDAYLNVHAGNPVVQISETIQSLGKEFELERPDLVVVFGDVNSTLAAAITANKLGIQLAHVEAGLRSFDLSMPEEHNRKVTDVLSEFLFTPSRDGDVNLIREGIPQSRIFFVGNIMVDTLLTLRATAERAGTKIGLAEKDYALVTLHRPSNVDNYDILSGILSALSEISKELPVIFPAHPRTMKMIEHFKVRSPNLNTIQFTEPLGYLEFIKLMMHARIVLTDSGGVQEETTVLGVTCLTLRENTERPITITEGTNQLVGITREGILNGFALAKAERSRARRMPELWDGRTAQRIAAVLMQELS
jgi:UDP-N-acetylglucosamine 2-epimerase (non-hydrolysing)